MSKNQWIFKDSFISNPKCRYMDHMDMIVGFFLLELHSVWLGSIWVKWLGRYMDSTISNPFIFHTILFRRWNGNFTWLWPSFRSCTTKTCLLSYCTTGESRGIKLLVGMMCIGKEEANITDDKWWWVHVFYKFNYYCRNLVVNIYDYKEWHTYNWRLWETQNHSHVFTPWNSNKC